MWLFGLFYSAELTTPRETIYKVITLHCHEVESFVTTFFQPLQQRLLLSCFKLKTCCFCNNVAVSNYPRMNKMSDYWLETNYRLIARALYIQTEATSLFLLSEVDYQCFITHYILAVIMLKSPLIYHSSAFLSKGLGKEGGLTAWAVSSSIYVSITLISPLF